MIRAFQIRWVRYLVLVAIALVILFFALQAWLVSGIGRGLVESRLSAALGRPVRLDGDFRIRALPYPGASGTAMEIFTSDGRWLVLETGSYFAQLSLLPLLRGEVEVVALALEEASVDLARLLGEPPVESDTEDPKIQLPAIGRLDLVDSAIYFDGMNSLPYLRISRFSLDDFQVETPSEFEAEMALVADAGDEVSAVALGTLSLYPDGQVEVVLSSLDAEMADYAVRQVAGKLAADPDQSSLVMNLHWESAGQTSRIEAIAAWDRLYEGSDAAALSGYSLESVALELGNERISGRGCAFGSEPLQLNLELSSDSLDLDAVYAMIDSWRRVPAGPSRFGQGTSEGETGMPELSPELPFDLSLELSVAIAELQGALARGAFLRVGSAPRCNEVR